MPAEQDAAVVRRFVEEVMNSRFRFSATLGQEPESELTPVKLLRAR